jgi:hypothetical protein
MRVKGVFSSMPDKDGLRKIIRDNQDAIVESINTALRGKKLRAIEPVLRRVGRGQELPHWFAELKTDGVLPNLDGKTIGSVIEMILVGVLETTVFKGKGVPPLRINPARGVDLPDLDLGIKSPSENYCTSEPFFSAYERLLGGECDIWVLLTDYQDKKDTPPLRLQIIKWRYLTKTQVADSNLCMIARTLRDFLLADSEASAQKVFRFLAYINQSDWRAKWLLKIVASMKDEKEVGTLVAKAKDDFKKKNAAASKSGKELLSDNDLEAIEGIRKVKPSSLGVITAADNWVLEMLKDAARAPGGDEWNRLKRGPLDGKIGMSFALQWRYNFGKLFGVDACDLDVPLPED